ncbi:hypothetical protein J2D73_18645 [Acetobacter sacchari]|uniref:Uncharacterized protein n=1 Tax=Acetobacter sacchari TaxID=2661687 RepID=A0ABS3M110_9PROT|nr:hypothetical protein [Acetobacter sacchari]MBO1361805.1 hypothetical protein [Acetobacter sacchari]
MKTVIGIDPGINGAVAIMNERGDLIEVLDMPTTPTVVSGKTRSVVSAPLLATMIRAHDPSSVWIEKVHAGPKMGSLSAMSFGIGVGVIEGVVAALGKPLTTARPAIWKKAMSCPADKDAARTRAMQLFPTSADLFKRKKDDGRAEAAMIALYGLNHSA